MAITFTGDYQTGTIDDTFQSLDPTETYLRTNQDPLAKDATAYSLASLGLTAGTWVYMSLEGDYDSGNGNGDLKSYMTGVFSESDTLLDSTNLNRVSGAVDAGDNTDPDGDFGIRISTPLLVGHTTDGTMDISGEAVVASFVHLGVEDSSEGTLVIDAGGH